MPASSFPSTWGRGEKSFTKVEWLYRTATGAYHLGIRAAARLGHPRATKWVAGREMNVRPAIEALHATGRPVAWLHAASLGEFEQGRPVLTALRQARPDLAFVVTFFSPSGYERCRDTGLAEVVAYLPPDTPQAARTWMALLRPRFAVFVKYEFWHYHLAALHTAGVPTFLIAGSFRSGQPFFQPYGAFWRSMLGRFTHLMVQTEGDRTLLKNIGVHRVTVTGDPRIDRTLALAAAPFTDARLTAFTAGHPTLIAGSVWEPDVRLLAGAWPSLPPEWRLVLAPHQLQEKALARWQTLFTAERYSGPEGESRVLILDTIGILSRAYRYARLAYVGGAFGSGLHNTLEPMSYGLPVLFGPKHAKFPEAREAMARGGAFSVGSAGELTARLTDLRDPLQYGESQKAQQQYAAAHAGAGIRTAALLLRLLPLLLLLLGPLSAFSQSWGPADRLTRTLDGLYTKGNLLVAVTNAGWHPGLCLAATQLATGETASLEIHLLPGRTYTFIASAEHGVRDVDLLLRAAGGEEILSDTEDDQTPIVEFTAEEAGAYTLQLHLVDDSRDSAMVALGILSTFGEPLSSLTYRNVSRQFGAAAGAVRAAGGATRFQADDNTWCLLGYLLAEGEGATVEKVRLSPDNRLSVAAAGSPEIQDMNLFLADDSYRIIRSDRAQDPYPMIEVSGRDAGIYRLRLSVQKARSTGLILLGFFND